MNDSARTSAETRAPWWASALLVSIAAALYAIHLDRPGFFDNEGRYAEVARQMLQTGDWITPRLDDTLFLNKPPLTFWLTATAFEVLGRTEWARVVSVAGVAVSVFATIQLGALLYGRVTGLWAGVFAATMLGVVLEARTLRPDCLLLATITVALWCAERAARTPAPARRRWLTTLYLALGLGVLAKGLVPVVIVAPLVMWPAWRARGVAGLWELRPGLGLAIGALLVLPWHVAVAWRHDGFAWDYVVNQHLLFFLDKKLPRDSSGDPLWFFWTAFTLRALPWIVLVPLAGRSGSPLPWQWLAVVMGFFSLAPSRLEHYGLPALPAVALLAARGAERLRNKLVAPRSWLGLQAVGAGVAAAAMLLLLRGEQTLRGAEWIAQAPTLVELTIPGGSVLAVLGVALMLTASRRHADGFLIALALGTLAMAGVVVRALIAAEPLFSWRPVAAAIDAQVAPTTPVVFESPEEYQLVGGLSYYLDRHVTLLEFPGFVPPTYLAHHFRSMFLPRDRFAERWQSDELLVFVSDPQRQRDTPVGLVPGSFHVVTHLGDRWVLTNAPPHDAR